MIKVKNAKNIISVCIVVFLAITIHLPAFSKQYYVSYDGNDVFNGTLFKPFKSINKASEIAVGGDTIFVLTGVYPSKVHICKKGTRQTPILFKTIGKVDIVAPDDMKFWDALIKIDSSAYVIIDGFNIMNSKWFGIQVLSSNDIVLRNNFIDISNASAIYVKWCSSVKILNNEIKRACSFPYLITLDGKFTTGAEEVNIDNISSYLISTQKHGTQECMSVIDTHNFEIAYNKVHESGIWDMFEGGGSGSGGEGIDAKESCKNGIIHHNLVFNLDRLGIYCDAWLSKDFENIKIYSNIVHNCRNGIGISGEAGGTVRNIEIFNNLVYNIVWTGIGLYSWHDNGEKYDIKIFNNTIFQTNNEGIQVNGKKHSHIEIFNNILFKTALKESKSLLIGDAKEVKSYNNLIDIDPKFIDIRNGLFELGRNSPAIDKGMEITFPFDISDNKRTVGKSTDIGAFEFNSINSDLK